MIRINPRCSGHGGPGGEGVDGTDIDDPVDVVLKAAAGVDGSAQADDSRVGARVCADEGSEVGQAGLAEDGALDGADCDFTSQTGGSSIDGMVEESDACPGDGHGCD